MTLASPDLKTPPRQRNAPSAGEVGTPEPKPQRRIPEIAVKLTPLALYVAIALWVTGRLWRNLDGRYLTAVSGDHTQFQWMFRHAVKVVTEGANPFFTHALNAPDGVNLMANTSSLGLTLPLVPVTMLWGPQTSFAVVITLGLVGTALGWQYLFRRHLRASPLAAAVGGGFCGFAPGMISHANGHANWTAMFLVPFLVIAALRLREPDQSIRNGVKLALLVIWQAFINEEVLLYTALACGVFMVSYAIMDRSHFRTSLPSVAKGLSVGGLIALTALAYPLYLQFFGPQHYRGLPRGIEKFSSDLSAMASFPTLSLGGDAELARRFSWNLTEQNSFLGWPLLLLSFALIVWMWERLMVRAMVITALIFIVLSLGAHLRHSGSLTGIPLPWKWLQHLPLMEHIVTTRFGLVLIPIVGSLLALGLTRMAALPAQTISGLPLRAIAQGIVFCALLPLVPLPLPATNISPTPRFIADGAWQQYVPAGKTIATVPLTSDFHPDAMRWFARTGENFAIAGGYFIGPDGKGKAKFGAPLRPTTRLVNVVAATGVVPPITEKMKADFAADVRYWNAAVLVMPTRTRNNQSLRQLINGLAAVGGVSFFSYDRLDVWDVNVISDGR
jgi:hypothetical protein